VRLATRAGQFLLASFLLYVVPLLALIGGAVLGEILGAFYALPVDRNLLAAILGLTFMVGSFFIIRIGSRAIPRGTFMPEIIEILPGEECSEEQNGY
jgi:sigma-E factor negative regulatory protein RseC